MDNFESQIPLLLKTLKSKVFRFIVIQYNHRRIIQRVKDEIKKAIKGSNIKDVFFDGKNFSEIFEFIKSNPGKILAIDDFDKILAINEFYINLNQRRDSIASTNVSLICFLPEGENYISDCVKKIPDLWSFRSLVLDLRIETKEDLRLKFSFDNGLDTENQYSGLILSEKKKEYNRLKRKLSKIEKNDESIGLLNTLYPQIINICDELGKYKEGLFFADEWYTIAIKNKFEEKGNEIFPEILADRAKMNWEIGNYPEAHELMEKVLSLCEKIYGSGSIEFNENQANLALILKDMERYSEAKKIAEITLEKAINIYGENHPIVAKRRTNLALILHDLGEYSEAKKLNELALASDILYYGEEHPSVAIKQSNLAVNLSSLGELLKAKQLLEKAIISDIKYYGIKHPTTAASLSNLSVVLIKSGEYLKARELIKDAYSILVQFLGANHPKTRIVKNNIKLLNIILNSQFKKLNSSKKRLKC